MTFAFPTALSATMKTSRPIAASSARLDALTASTQRCVFSVLQDSSSDLTICVIQLVKSDTERTLPVLLATPVLQAVPLVQALLMSVRHVIQDIS